MSQKLMELCVKSRDVQRYVRHFANKLSSQFPSLLDFEDGENLLWLAVFRAVDKRYTPNKDLIQFAKRAVFSQYGSSVRLKSNESKRLNETALRDSNDYFIVGNREQEKVDAKFALDQIERDLKERAREGKHYVYARAVFELLRHDVTITQCCKRLKISRPYGYKLFYEIIQKTGDKYRESAISVE